MNAVSISHGVRVSYVFIYAETCTFILILPKMMIQVFVIKIGQRTFRGCFAALNLRVPKVMEFVS